MRAAGKAREGTGGENAERKGRDELMGVLDEGKGGKRERGREGREEKMLKRKGEDELKAAGDEEKETER